MSSAERSVKLASKQTSTTAACEGKVSPFFTQVSAVNKQFEEVKQSGRNVEALLKCPYIAACASLRRQPALFDDRHAVATHPKGRRESTDFVECGLVVSVGRQPGPSIAARTWAEVNVKPRILGNN